MINSGDGDKEATTDECVESYDKRGEEIIGDDGVGSAIIGEARAVRRVDKGSTGVIGLLGKLWKEMSSTEKVKEDRTGRAREGVRRRDDA